MTKKCKISSDFISSGVEKGDRDGLWLHFSFIIMIIMEVWALMK